jgi:hypothetical protein
MDGDWTTPGAAESLTAAELRVIREGLGLSIGGLADYLNVDARTINRWEIVDTNKPGARIPTVIAGRLLELNGHAAKLEQNLVTHDPHDIMITYRNDAQFWEHHPDCQPLTAAWHRAACYRIDRDASSARIIYADQQSTAENTSNS